MTPPPLGRLEKVELRDVWLSEPADFTPWLAREENIALLGDTIRIELEVVAQEKEVGPFRADILCKNTLDGHYVLIENQLEATDHLHLGQLMTYSAGLDAVTIIWVARSFTEEHRAALDWLNSVTAEGINFFGLEIELWRIGDSPVAPKFNVVSQPNEWTKTVRTRSQANTGELTETEQLHLDFWTQFQKYLSDQNSPVKCTRPSKDHWKDFALGRTDFTLCAANGMRDGNSLVQLIFKGSNSKAHYHLVRQRHKDKVEAAFGHVVWEENPGKIQSHITLRRDANPSDRETWPELNEWFRTTLEKFDAFFRPIVKTLNAADYVPPEDPISSANGASKTDGAV